MSARLADRLARAFRAARDFLRGFVGMPAATLRAADAHDAQHALEERAGRRPTCC